MPNGQSIAAPPQYGAAPRAAEDQALFLRKWLWVWILLITVVLLVVITYLFFITGSLRSINNSLEPTTRNVQGAGGSVQRLPDQVQAINRSLEGIDPALKPIPERLDAIIQALTPINNNLQTTAGSLSDTSGTLSGQVLGRANAIQGLLVSADEPGDDSGVQDIHQKVGVANSILGPAKGDTANILGGLRESNRHLDSICNKVSDPRCEGP